MGIFLQTLTNGVMASLILILIATGLCLIFGILDIVNFAHGEFYMLGGFGIWWFLEAHPLLESMPGTVRYVVAVLLTMVIVAILGIVVEKFVYRPVRQTHASVMIISLGVMFILQALALVSFGPVDKSASSPFTGLISLGPISFSNERLAAIVSCIVFIFLLYLLIEKTKAGKAMRAVSQDFEAAQVSGLARGGFSHWPWGSAVRWRQPAAR